MKICDVVKNSIWYDPRVKKQIKTYISSGMEIVGVGVKDPRYNKDEVLKIGCEINLAEIGSKYYAGKQNIFNKIIRELKTNKEIYRKIVSSNADLIHANDLNALIPAYKASKKLKCKLIYDTHEIFLENPWIAKNKIVKFIWGYYERKIVHKVDAVVCVSHAAAEYLKKKYNITKPIVVTNCISGDNIIEKAVEKAEPKQILNHGQFYGGRGYDLMIEAAPLLSQYNDLQFVLRGFGVLEEQLRARVKELDAKNVCFAPPVKVEELIPCASRAFIGLAITQAISINFELSVSNKIFEYAAAGLPVIMSDIPEHRYLNDKYNFGIIIKNDTPEEIADAVLQLYKNKDMYDKCSDGSKRLSKEINWDTEFGKLIEIEKCIVSNKDWK